MVQPEFALDALHSWVSWANSGTLPDGVPGFLTSRLPAEAEAVDWEAALKRQNAANDELCSENSQLQVEVQRLAAEDTELPEEEDGWLEELIQSLCAVATQDEEGQKLRSCLEQAIRAAHADDASGATMAEEVAHLVSEKMALREQVERQQEQIELLEDQLRDMGPLPHERRDLSKQVAQHLSDAGGALSALSQALQPKSGAVPVGSEVEIISGRGSIVRSGESLRSDVVRDLPPGSRVKVVAISKKYPRRLEIIYAPDDEKGLVGWISASSKDGRLLVRVVDAEPVPARELQEQTSATLSTQEWECLNEANAASAQQIQELSNQLAVMGSQLLQSFEMQSVLAQLQKTLHGDLDRAKALREAASMANEELRQRRALLAAEAAEAPAEAAEAAEAVAVEVSSPMAVLAIDWERLLSERETTAAALSAALQRLGSLEKELQELTEERRKADGDQDLRPLRNRLRHHVEKPEDLPQEVLVASEGLFRRRAADLSQQIRELRQELRLAKEGERTLRRSVTARSHALQGLLHRAAMSGLALPQCGPVRLAPDPDAERAALLAAVQEQLQENLELQS